MMQESVESADQAEALVNTLHIEGSALSDGNLTGLTNTDFEQIADLQAELEGIHSEELETTESIGDKQMLDEDIVETEIGEQEVEIEAEEIEQAISPGDILPEYRENESVIKYDGTPPPPLRPLTIAPKPANAKVPMALKTAAVVNAVSGQQIVLIQSPGGSSNTVNLASQAIKLVSAQGQPVTIPNLQNVALGNKSGVVQLRAINKNLTTVQTSETPTTVTTQLKTVTGAIKKLVPQNKNILAKVIVGGQSGQVVLTSQASESSPQPQIKLLSSVAGTIPSTAKTITLAQAQQMGLISSGKVQHLMPQSPNKQAVVVNKTLQAKAIKIVPQGKSPTKILPAPIQAQKIQPAKNLQRVIIKQAGHLKAGTMVTNTVNQVIRIPSSQALTAGQIHQINVPGKGVQYIRFMTAATTTNTTTNTNSTVKAITQTTSTLQKAQVVPVAGISVCRSNTSNKNSTTTTNVIKVVPISTALTRSAVPKPVTSQRLLIPKSTLNDVVPLSSGQTRPVVPKPVTSQRVLIPATNASTRPAQTIATIPASALNQIQGAIAPSGNNVSQIVMLPAPYVQQIQTQSQSPTTTVTTTKITSGSTKVVPQKVTVKLSPTQAKENISTTTETQNSATAAENFARTLEPNGLRPRKPCNCAKSLCLKLYCDCFANGEFCHLCNCMNCYNNLEKEEERQRAIRNCLERNPNAFRPKIGKGRDAGESSVRKHTKGCNCKRSGCLKNYCECYEAKIACSSNCKCIGCRNIEDSMEKKNVRPSILPEVPLQTVPLAKSKQMLPTQDITSFRPLLSNTATKSASTCMTNVIIEATNLCLLAQADEAERNMVPDEMAKKRILEEFGRCLVEIIECSANASNPTTTT